MLPPTVVNFLSKPWDRLKVLSLSDDFCIAEIAPERMSFLAASLASFAVPLLFGVRGAPSPVEPWRFRPPTRSRGFSLI